MSCCATDAQPPDENALLVPVDDADALAAAINRLRGDEGLAAKLVKNGFETFARSYSKEVIVGQYLAMFRDVLERHSAGRR